MLTGPVVVVPFNKFVPEGMLKVILVSSSVAITDVSIPHQVIGHYGAGRVLLKPASEGTGVIAGGAARVILEEAGVHDVLCKSLGSANHINVARATIAGLAGLKRPDEIAILRGLDPEEFVPGGLWAAYLDTKKKGSVSAGSSEG